MLSFPLPRLHYRRLITGPGVFLLILFFSQSTAGRTLVLESTVQQTGLLELYTSEGCSSCPPADRFVSSLLNKQGLWSAFIPIALHVDYWDYIGWQDRFASPAYSQRQRRYAQENSVKTVYTPGFVYNGREWRNWIKKPFRNFPKGGNPGILRLTVKYDSAEIEFTPESTMTGNIEVHIALLGFNISTRVKAGENRGKTLNHNFVVLGLEKDRLESSNRLYMGNMRLPQSAIDAERYAIVAWLSRPEDLSPLQAVGGWLKDQ